jgi:hypothetical protein
MKMEVRREGEERETKTTRSKIFQVTMLKLSDSMSIRSKIYLSLNSQLKNKNNKE